MGFLDKAKKLADQAQDKLDEVQRQFNEQQGKGQDPAAGAGPPVEYDQHGRATSPGGPAAPAPKAETVDPAPPQGDALRMPQDAPSPPADKTPDLRPEASDPDPPHGDPLRDRPEPKAPPGPGSGMTSGDPLGG